MSTLRIRFVFPYQTYQSNISVYPCSSINLCLTLSFVIHNFVCKQLSSTLLNSYRFQRHTHHMLDPVLSQSTKLARFRMVIVFTTPCHVVRSNASFFTSHFSSPILYLLFPCLFRSSSTTTHFNFKAFLYHIFIFFPQNMTVPPYILALAILSKDCFMPSMSINTSLSLQSNSFTPHITRIIILSAFLKIASLFLSCTMLHFHTT